MRLNTIRIRNYKGFADSGVIELGKHWTVVVGRNNAGKTAFLECFGFQRFQNKAHLNISQDPSIPRNPTSRVDVSIDITGEELERAVLRAGGQCDVPVPAATNGLTYLRHVLFGTHNTVFKIWRAGALDWQSEQYPSHGLFTFQPGGQTTLCRIDGGPDHQALRELTMSGGSSDSLPSLVGTELGANAYVFRAERRVAGTSQIQNEMNLSVDASNLAGALHYLYTSNPNQFDDFMKLVRQVLPDIEAITIPPSGGHVQIRIWNSGYQQRRSDLAIPLEECGTGIGQVLAILFVAATAQSGKIIVIDEPNSFLHPGASRVLMQLLRAFDQHQFIIATHSPEIIGATKPDRLAAVQWKNGESQVTVYDGTELAGVQTALGEIGVRLSDVFGYDAIAWVEGATEAKCFPLLLEASGKQMPPRTAFVSVVNTGDFEGVNADTFWRAYKRLADQSPFMPQSISFSFDREDRSEELCADLVKKSNKLVHFLPRRTYENFLLHPSAIAAVLKEEVKDCSVSKDDVESWMNEHHLDVKYYSTRGVTAGKPKDDWITSIHAPNFLHDLIGQLTNHTQDLKGNKVRYSLALTEWLIKNDKPFLNDLFIYVAMLVNQAHEPQDA
jgi:hypothetical protein